MMRPSIFLGLLAAVGLAAAEAASTVTVEVDIARKQGAVPDLLGANRKPTFSSNPPGTNYDAANLYAAFGVSQVRTHDTGVDLCKTYTAATRLNATVSPPVEVTGCTLTGTTGRPRFVWTPTSSLDADLDNPDNYDFASVDEAILAAIATGARIYLRLGESYNGPNDTADPVAWAKVAANIYRHVLGVFKPTAGIALDPAFVEVHNEPDGVFWSGTQSTFRTLYAETAARVRAAAAAAGRTVKVGGSGFTTNILTTSQQASNAAYQFVAGVGAASLDFYSAHYYGSCSTATLASAASFLRSLRALVDAQGGTGKPMQVTEWNIGLGEVCGNAFYAEPRTLSFASGFLTLMQDPAQAIEAAHFYSGVPIMALFDFMSTAGTVKVNPSAWAFWAHAKRKGGTALSAQVCPSGGSCVAGYAAESAPLLAVASESGGRQVIVVTNDGSSAVSYTLRLKSLAAGTVTLTVATPPSAAQGIATKGTTVAADATALAALVAAVPTTTYAGLNAIGNAVDLALEIPARGVQVIEVADASAAPRLGNISTRGPVYTGDGVMIGGFAISGSSPKKVLITARGPSLAAYGVPGTLANPKLELYVGQVKTLENDDWQGNSADDVAAIQATGIAPADARESALLATLQPGLYTAVVSGSGGGTGVGIVEVFEMDRPDVPLVNISTRGLVQSGDNVMIGGFVIQGTSPRTVLVTARGPSLAAYGISNPLADPKLELYSGQTKVYSNDNWESQGTAEGGSGAVEAIRASGLAPTNAKEAALRLTLNPGAYTAIVSGVGGTGVGIVEVFAQ